MDRIRLMALACALLGGMGTAQAADDVSRWDGDARSAARLIAGSRPAGGGALRAGIEIRLKPGWHTYWRYPGDAGVPPQFDFSASENVKAIVLWPAPQRLSQEGSVSIGYERNVILPVQAMPLDGAKPVVLRLKLDYAVCEKLCVPAEAKAELVLTGAPASQDAALAAAEARVPKRMPLGGGGTLAVRSVKREAGATRPRMVIDVAAPPATPVDLFAEGPTQKWALPVPTLIDGAPPGMRRFVFELDGAPPGEAYQGTVVTLTAVTPTDAIEVPIRLD